MDPIEQLQCVLVVLGLGGVGGRGIGSWGGVCAAARDWDPWCLAWCTYTTGGGFPSFSFFFCYLFVLLFRPVGGLILFFSPLTFTSC